MTRSVLRPNGIVSPARQFGFAVLSVGGSAGEPSSLLEPEHESHSVSSLVSDWTDGFHEGIVSGQANQRPGPNSPCDHRLMPRITVTIEGQGWADVQQLELPQLPREGDLIETKYGTCQVTHSESTANTEGFDGKIVCSGAELDARFGAVRRVELFLIRAKRLWRGARTCTSEIAP